MIPRDKPEDILKRDFSEDFIQKMRHSIINSHYKYGWMSETYSNKLADCIKSLEMRLELYKQTGNADYLVDVANFAMIETMYPQHPNAHFQSTDSDKSPGLAGISAKQLLEGGSFYE